MIDVAILVLSVPLVEYKAFLYILMYWSAPRDLAHLGLRGAWLLLPLTPCAFPAPATRGKFKIVSSPGAGGRS